MNIKVNNQTKIRCAKHQYAISNKLLTEAEIENRKHLSEPDLIELFNRIWKNFLYQAVINAKHCSIEFVREKLKEKQKNSKNSYLSHVKESQQHREFYVQNQQFIVQLNPLNSEEYELTQIWFIPSSDIYPNCLLVCFDDIEEKKRFTTLAEQLRWKDTELCKDLVRDFIRKHERMP